MGPHTNMADGPDDEGDETKHLPDRKVETTGVTRHDDPFVCLAQLITTSTDTRQ